MDRYLLLILLFEGIEPRRVDVYHLQQDDQLISQESDSLIFPPVFSICFSFMVDKFSYMETVKILHLKQKDMPQLHLDVGLQLDMSKNLPKIRLNMNINEEMCVPKNPFLFNKNVWTRLCIGLDWKNWTFGRNKVNKDFTFFKISEKEKAHIIELLIEKTS